MREQRFILWYQTRSSLSSRPKTSSVDQKLSISSLVSSYHIISLSASSNLVGIWDGISAEVRMSYPFYRLSSWPKIWISGCFPREPPWYASLKCHIWVYLIISGIPRCLLGIYAPWIPPSWSQKVLNRASESGFEVGSLLGFSVGGPDFGVGSSKVGSIGESLSLDSSG